MRVCGIICEYDPFHNGHEYLLRQARDACDYVVCVMSGHFTQRGQPSLLCKWTRAEMALHCGADAVFELPTLFAVRDAERFARGGVSLLTSLGVVTHLAFGSETGDLPALLAQAQAEPDTHAIAQRLSQGKTLARARGETLGLTANTPNDALAVEYLRANERLGSPLTPIAVRRTGSGHHDPALGSLASATAIRAAIRRGEDVSSAMPTPAHVLLMERLACGDYQLEGALDTALLTKLRAMPAERLADIADVSEGLEHRILRAAQAATDRGLLLDAIKCKRYTRARLSRVLTQALLDITKEMATSIPTPSYARLMAFRETARPLLAEMRDASAIPIVQRAAKHRLVGDAAFALDLLATDIWALGVKSPPYRAGGRDLTQSAIRLL